MSLNGRKKILILGAGLEQSLVIQEAKDLEYYVIACDSNPDAVGFDYSDVGIVLDIKNPVEVINIAKRHRVNGVFSHAIEIPHIVSSVAEKLGLPCLSSDIAWLATNKYLRISHLSSNSIPCAKFEVINERSELFDKATLIGYPLIIKPVDNAAARGVCMVDSSDTLENAYSEALKYSTSKVVLLEEKLTGPEISTESIVVGDKIITFAFADRNYSKSDLYYPFIIEDGINFPTELTKKMQQRVISLVENTIRVIGVNYGSAKGDIIIDKGEPKVIEMAARTSGGWFGAGSIRLATGVNMLKPLLQMAVDDEPDLEALKPIKELGCAQRYFIPTKEGVFKSITGFEEAKSMPGVSMLTSFPPKPGEFVRKAQNHSDRYAQVICTAENRELAIERAEKAISRIQIEFSN